MCSNWHHRKLAMWLKQLGGQLEPVGRGPELHRQSSAIGWKPESRLLRQQSLKLHFAYSSVRIDV